MYRLVTATPIRCVVKTPRYRPINYNAVRLYTERPNGDFNKREKTLEDKNVRDHDNKLLEELAAQLRKKTEQLKQAESKVAAATGETYSPSGAEAVANSLSERMLEVRKELLGEVRQIDDKLAELKFRLQRLERKVGL